MARHTANSNDQLFEDSSNGAVSALTAVFFILSCLCFFGGILLLSYAFSVDTFMIEMFGGGLLLLTFGLLLPTGILSAMGK